MPSPINLDVTGDNYWHVELGPLPNVPDWHVQSTGSSYAFPDETAALAFARVHQKQEPNREVRVVPPRSGVTGGDDVPSALVPPVTPEV